MIMLVALVMLGVVGVRVLARDRFAMYEELARDRLHSLDEISRAFASDLGDIAEDLDLATALLTATDAPEVAERELHAIATIKREYLVMDALRGSARTRVVALDAPPGALEASDVALRETIAKAAKSPGALHISGPLAKAPDPAAWYRVYARSPASGPAIAVVVNTALLLDRLKLLRDKSSVLLVVGSDGNAAALSDDRLAAAVQAPGPLRDLLARAATHEDWQLLDGDEAQALGLPPISAVATAVPFTLDDGEPWRLLLVTSNVVLQTQEHTLIRRLAVGATLALLLLLAGAGYVVFTTRRTATLRERLRQADQLAHLTEKAEKILDHIPSGVLAISAGLRITACNRWFAQRHGGDVIGRELHEVFTGAPREDVDVLIELVQGAIAAHAPRSRLRTKLALLGADAFLSIHAIPLERSVADVHLLVVFEDLTPMRRIEERLLHSEKLATAGQLAAGIAHEIGTPLNIVRGRAELALSRLGDHPQAQSQKVIVDQIDRVTRMIQQLLDVARPSRARPEPVDVAHAFELVVELTTAEAKRRQVALRVSAPPGLTLSADPDQLQQALLNLVMNAIDASKPLGHVDLAATLGDGNVIIEISDDGTGIPVEQQGQVFDPFFTTKKRGQGTGLGLWVVAQVVRTHAGEIELASSEQSGTTIRITWPTTAKKVFA